MQVRSLNRPVDVFDPATTGKITGLSIGCRMLLLMLNSIPLVHIAIILLVAIRLSDGFLGFLCCALVGVYLAPPITARIVLFLARPREGDIPVGSKDFFVWWITWQLQMLFCRFPALEELLRLVPGLYSFWLRIWGARIGRLTFWAPGVLILDRPFLNIGDDVVFGAGVRINGHVSNRTANGAQSLILGTVTVGNRCHVGGYSLLTAGTIVEDDQTTKAFLLSPPFSRWKDGQRVRPAR